MCRSSGFGKRLVPPIEVPARRMAPVRIIGLQCPFESEVRKKGGRKVWRTSDSGSRWPAGKLDPKGVRNMDF
jgi:hypothetical protein